jgi:hypothetical protein
VQEERAYFLAATGLLSEQYHRSFGDPEVALERSRLKHFLHGDENKA